MCTSILKCGILTKGIKLTRLVLFEVLAVLSFEVPRIRPFREGRHENLRHKTEAME